MPDTFRFKKEPQWVNDRSQVVLCVEDFECLLRLAERWLNSDGLPSQDMLHSNTKPALPQKNEPSMQTTEGPGYDESENHSTPKLCALDYTGSKMEDSDEESMLSQVCTASKILNSVAGQKLGKSPLDFLSKELSKFSSAKEIFSTRHFLPVTAVAPEFHKACDNVPNVLVIIKSGQYIAGGYTEVPFESRNYNHNTWGHYKPDLKMTTFLFSVNRQKVYPLKDKFKALNCNKDRGPSFGAWGLAIADDYMEFRSSQDNIHKTDSSFYSPTNQMGELFGVSQFSVDEYEVYKLE